jgi:NAD(P)-dependent dehydrogenase (short-subunit alcohol dehydrogenase family)
MAGRSCEQGISKQSTCGSSSPKAAIVGLTRTMAHELGRAGIFVNSALPGAILTERQRRLRWTPEYQAELRGQPCLNRLLMPEDVAWLIAFLASDSAAITTKPMSSMVDGYNGRLVKYGVEPDRIMVYMLICY